MQPNKNDQNALKGMPSIDGVRPAPSVNQPVSPPEGQYVPEPQKQPEQPNPVPIQDQPDPPSREPKRRKNKFPVIVVILAVVIVAGLAAAAIMLGLRQSSAQSQTLPRSASEETSDVQAEDSDESKSNGASGSPVINISN